MFNPFRRRRPVSHANIEAALRCSQLATRLADIAIANARAARDLVSTDIGAARQLTGEARGYTTSSERLLALAAELAEGR